MIKNNITMLFSMTHRMIKKKEKQNFPPIFHNHPAHNFCS